MQFTSVERILSYNTLEQEPQAECGNSPSDKWPEAGNIQFHHVSLYYYEGAPAALQDINVNIIPGERVSICVSRNNTITTCFLR